jgi:hypothetical protein
MDFKFGGNQMGQTCQSNEIFDHLHKNCHPVTCESKLWKNASGISVPREQQLELSVNMNASLSSWCSRSTLIKNVDYYSLENGSLVLNKTGEMLQPNDYELSQNGTVQICEDKLFPRFLNELKNYLKYSYAQRYLSNVCLTISVICLAFHIGIHIALPKLRNVPAKNLLALSCTLFLGQLLFLTGVGARDSIGYGPCAVIAVLIHWSLMSAFFWMNIMGFDMCRTFAGSQIKSRLQQPSVQRRRTTFRSYSVYGWSCPTVIVIIALIVDFCDVTDGGWAPHYGTHQCWMCNKNGLGLFFVLPMAILLAVNFIFFTLTAWSIVRQWRDAHFGMRPSRTFQQMTGSRLENSSSDTLKMSGTMINHQRRKSCIIRLRTRFFLYVKLGTIMGLGWISGFIAAMADVPGLWYPFILFNTLQGTFIFLAFDCKWKIYYMVYEAVTKRPHPSNLSSSHRVSTTASTKLQAARKISILTPPIVSNIQE